MDVVELQAEAGAADRSRVWTPDVELYNHERPIWGGTASSLGPRLAAVYACDGTPAGRAGCGLVWFSRPGMVSALCRFAGLRRFPLETLSCELELGAWIVDGRFQVRQLSPAVS